MVQAPEAPIATQAKREYRPSTEQQYIAKVRETGRPDWELAAKIEQEEEEERKAKQGGQDMLGMRPAGKEGESGKGGGEEQRQIIPNPKPPEGYGQVPPIPEDAKVLIDPPAGIARGMEEGLAERAQMDAQIAANLRTADAKAAVAAPDIDGIRRRLELKYPLAAVGVILAVVLLLLGIREVANNQTAEDDTPEPTPTPDNSGVGAIEDGGGDAGGGDLTADASETPLRATASPTSRPSSTPRPTATRTPRPSLTPDAAAQVAAAYADGVFSAGEVDKLKKLHREELVEIIASYYPGPDSDEKWKADVNSWAEAGLIDENARLDLIMMTLPDPQEDMVQQTGSGFNPQTEPMTPIKGMILSIDQRTKAMLVKIKNELGEWEETLFASNGSNMIIYPMDRDGNYAWKPKFGNPIYSLDKIITETGLSTNYGEDISFSNTPVVIFPLAEGPNSNNILWYQDESVPQGKYGTVPVIVIEIPSANGTQNQ